jgi:hypothetical protein
MSESIHIFPHSCAACTGNSNTTSFPVNRRYTDENESSLYSNDVESFASKNLEAFPIISELVLVPFAMYPEKSQLGKQQREWEWKERDPRVPTLSIASTRLG